MNAVIKIIITWVVIAIGVVLAINALAATSIEFRWVKPPSYVTNSNFILFHSTQPSMFNEIYYAGNGTNYFYSGPVAPGLNYFTVVYFGSGTNNAGKPEMSMSQPSNEVCVTNTVTTVASVVILSSTNINGGWTPVQTNSIIVGGIDDEFFKAVMKIEQTNNLTYPNNILTIPR
jgi:hypothetical protein